MLFVSQTVQEVAVRLDWGVETVGPQVAKDLNDQFAPDSIWQKVKFAFVPISRGSQRLFVDSTRVYCRKLCAQSISKEKASSNESRMMVVMEGSFRQSVKTICSELEAIGDGRRLR